MERTTEISRREAIFDASLEEFAAVGYERANTNRICECAGVSKGLLFHYYGSKKQLYMFTVEKCTDDVLSVFEGFSTEGLDFTGALLAYSKMKFYFYSVHPLHYKILNEAFLLPPIEVTDTMRAKYMELEKIGIGIMSGLVDKITLREGISKETALAFLTSMSRATEMYSSVGDWTKMELTEELYQKIEDRYRILIDLILHGVACD
jgi:AcrR family transcriptional regulator